MSLIVNIGIFILNIFYFFIKLFPTKNKITFISREKNSPSIDFIMLEKELKSKNKDLEVVMLCKRLESGIMNKISYIFHMFKQMYHIATSKVVVLDTYCICISILKHKKSLKVIQMWHAMGAFKKFGYSILDQDEGSSSKVAKLMRMHKNYDYVFTSSESSLPNFAEAFGVEKEKMVIMPLPKVDLIKDKKNVKLNKNKVLETYPELKKKKTILYAPTFRKNRSMKKDIYKLIDEVDFKRYNLVIKLHPLAKTVIDDKRVIFDKKFTTIEMACACDYVITDYSAVVFEIALLNKPLFFYAYDKDTYLNSRNFYIDYNKEMPGYISKDPKKIIKAIENNNYDLEKVKMFSNKNIENIKGNCTTRIASFILNLM